MGKKLVAARDLDGRSRPRRGRLVAKSPADGGLPPYELDALLGRTLGARARVRARRSPDDDARAASSEPVARARTRRPTLARDPACGLRLRRRVHRQPRVGERARRGDRPLLPRRRARAAQAATRSASTHSILSIGDDAGRQRARARSSASTASTGSRTSCRCFTSELERAGSGSTRPRTSATTSTTPSASARSGSRRPGRRLAGGRAARALGADTTGRRGLRARVLRRGLEAQAAAAAA